jgi:hypothetical protein
MAQGTYGVSVNIGGVSVQKSIVRTADHPNTYEVTLPVAWAVSSWVKTDADTAAGNLAGGHGQVTGTYDVYWTGGARYDVAVTVTVNALALEGGTGTDFPASATTTVVISKQTQINTAIDGDAIEIAALSLEYTDSTATSRGRLLFEDATGDDIAAITLTGNSPLVYDVEGGVSNPFAGDPITVCRATQESTTATPVIKILSLEDSSP